MIWFFGENERRHIKRIDIIGRIIFIEQFAYIFQVVMNYIMTADKPDIFNKIGKILLVGRVKLLVFFNRP